MMVSEDKLKLKVDWYLACQEGGLQKNIKERYSKINKVSFFNSKILFK